MVKKLVFLVMTFALLSGVASAKDKCSISGEATFRYEGDIYVCVCDAGDWVNFHTFGHRLAQKKCQVTKWTDDVKKAGKIFFNFENIPKGTYSIIAYQDVNNNGEVDFDNQIISEPWQCFQEWDSVMGHASWNQVRFDLEEDMKGIEIHM